jgi:predicted dehydrogenase
MASRQAPKRRRQRQRERKNQRRGALEARAAAPGAREDRPGWLRTGVKVIGQLLRCRRSVAALVDRELSLARRQRRFPAARIAPSLTDLTDETIDAVIVATPPETHVDSQPRRSLPASTCCRKPLALTAEDCRTLGAQALEAGLILMVGHTFRFSPAVQHVRQLIAQHELGEVYYIDSQRLNLGRVRKDVDAIWNFAPHDISIIQEWFGRKPVAVHCHAYDYLQHGIPDLGFRHPGVAAKRVW